VTTSLFDISADLDTPVSAYLKLKPFRPRFLLESVEGGERLARYSFIGFGDCLEFRLDASGLVLGAERLPRPPTRPSCWRPCGGRSRGSASRNCGRGFPLLGGLVGVASYDLVRYFERLPAHARADDDCPEAHYVAPRSLLVFDHLTRRAALLHAGSELERQSLRREVIRALRGGLPGPAWAAASAHRGEPVGGRVHRARGPAPRNTSPRATSTSWCCRCASRAAATSTRSRPTAPCGC
jgi:anthranilate synthase component I